MKLAGTICACVGIVLLVFALTMNTTVPTAYGAVHNLGLLEQKQTYTITALTLLLLGAGLFVAGTFRASPGLLVGNPAGQERKECEECGEMIATNARKCRFCGAQVIQKEFLECGFCDQSICAPDVPCSARSRAELQSSLGRIENRECLAALLSQGVVEDV